MKNSIKKLVVMSAIGLSFVAVQSVSADTVEGTIDAITFRPNVVVVDGTAVYGVKYKYLETQFDVVLSVDQEVSFEVYDYLCSDGTTVLKACEITVDEQVISLRECL